MRNLVALFTRDPYLVTAIALAKFVGVQSRAAKTDQRANACALLAANQCTESCARAGTNGEREFVTVFLPKAAALRRRPVVVIDATV